MRVKKKIIRIENFEKHFWIARAEKERKEKFLTWIDIHKFQKVESDV
jgi:hypothetical protein